MVNRVFRPQLYCLVQLFIRKSWSDNWRYFFLLVFFSNILKLMKLYYFGFVTGPPTATLRNEICVCVSREFIIQGFVLFLKPNERIFAAQDNVRRSG